MSSGIRHETTSNSGSEPVPGHSSNGWPSAPSSPLPSGWSIWFRGLSRLMKRERPAGCPVGLVRTACRSAVIVRRLSVVSLPITAGLSHCGGLISRVRAAPFVPRRITGPRCRDWEGSCTRRAIFASRGCARTAPQMRNARATSLRGRYGVRPISVGRTRAHSTSRRLRPMRPPGRASHRRAHGWHRCAGRAIGCGVRSGSARSPCLAPCPCAGCRGRARQRPRSLARLLTRRLVANRLHAPCRGAWPCARCDLPRLRPPFVLGRYVRPARRT